METALAKILEDRGKRYYQNGCAKIQKNREFQNPNVKQF